MTMDAATMDHAAAAAAVIFVSQNLHHKATKTFSCQSSVVSQSINQYTFIESQLFYSSIQ